ncbi:hypothetical protein BG015_007966 [Linnemannia schmuckeri]|uniref:Treslin N-terminal domain-containing protein n=1 Tax=Linnemannia schmuckeri TaxID=64567 RepID=A0A9P5S9G8_9FUNG|nr:hypothetical protein BG015_007966 [Linnemannia schmuckeri]
MLPLPLGALSSSSSALAGSSGKTPINVVFIIDTHLPHVANGSSSISSTIQARRAVTLLKRSLVRILLYFQCSMDPKFQWTFTFFNSRGTQEIGLVSKRMPRSMDIQTIEDCVQEYTKIVASEAASSSTSAAATSKIGTIGHSSPCYNLRRQLVHSLADFGLDIASYQSPMKPSATLARSQSLQKHFPPLNIRNYIYVISPLPQSWSETTFFLDGKKHNDTNLLGPRKTDILDVLKGIKDTFFEQQLWDRFLDQRTSLSWIDTNTNHGDASSGKAQTRVSATLLIRSTLELIMRAFGGHIIPQTILSEAAGSKDIYSFATIFQTYRSLQISPGLGVTMSKESWQAIPSMPSISSLESRPVKVMWSGELLCTDTLQFICSLDISTPLAFSDLDNSFADKIVSMHVVKRIPTTSLSSYLHSVRVSHTMLCFPRDSKNMSCERALYLLRSLGSKNDALLIRITLLSASAEDEQTDRISEGYQGRQQVQALLYSGAHGSGTMHILKDFSYLENAPLSKSVNKSSTRPFSMAMLEKSLGAIGAFVDQQKSRQRSRMPYRLEEMPVDIAEIFKLPQETTPVVTESKPTPSKPLPGDTVSMDDHMAVGLEPVDSIDDLCLGIRRAYIKHLYNNDYTVVDYVKRLNAASKEITVLAAKLSVPLKEAQQKLVAFMIEFLRIWPSKLGSKYKQIDKELNIGKSADTRTQDRYIILQDERPELDAWKARVNTSVKDNDVRMFVRKLKTKDTQIQIVQNLHVLLLISKYGLEENRPFKKDPGALKTTNHFMDELCISAVIEDRPAPGFLSPQTPRSKDLDPAKKFFIRAVARYYGPALPKVVEKLSVKCGVETSLLKSPRPSRGSKRAGLHRSVSMGVLQKPNRLDLSAATQTGTDGPLSSSSVKTPKDEVVAPKHGFPMSRQSTSDNPARSALDSIFRNRQVAMSRGVVKGRNGMKTSASSSSVSTLSATTQLSQGRLTAQPSQPQSRLPLQRSNPANSILDEMEDENGPPKLAKLKLKKFYHDKESEEVLKMFRRKGPLSKADAVELGASSSSIVLSQTGKDNNDDHDDSGDLSQYLSRKGTTSWGGFGSTTQSVEEITAWGLQSPKKQREISPSRTSAGLLAVSTDAFVPSTPVGHQGRNFNQEDPQRTPSTPTRRTRFHRYHSLQFIGDGSYPDTDRIPSTPTRRDQIHQRRSFAAQLRGGGGGGGLRDMDVLGSPGKRRRGGVDSDDATEEEYDKRILLDTGAVTTPRSIAQPHLVSKFISSPTSNHHRTRRNIDFSVFND